MTIASGDLMYSFDSTKFISLNTNTTDLGSTAFKFNNLYINSIAYASSFSSTNIYASSFTGNLVTSNSVSTITLAITQTTSAVSLNTGVPTFTAWYGSTQTALANPTAWLAVVVSGTAYKIPIY